MILFQNSAELGGPCREWEGLPNSCWRH